MRAQERENVLGSVLIVDPSTESREVLRTILELRGASILEAAAADEGLEMARQHHPQVIVLDAEQDLPDADEFSSDLDDQLTRDQAALVLLGRSKCYRGRLPKDQILSKPYHYAPLVRKIVTLLDKSLDKSEQVCGVAVCHPRTGSRKAV